MKVFTSYFAVMNKVRAAGLLPVAITWKLPNFVPRDFPQLPELAPDGSILGRFKRGQITEAQYKKLYLHQLNSVDQEFTNFMLSVMSMRKPVVLMCYEKAGTFCHRHFALDWLRSFCHPSEIIGEFDAT